MTRDAIRVVDYLDYREYLRDYYAWKKGLGRGFSYRSFSRRAGLRSPNYLKLVMDGQRNLTAEMAERFADALNLRGEEASYFSDLVSFCQAKTAAERGKCYERLISCRKYRIAHKLDVAHAAYYSTWYIPALRELAAREDFQEDPAWIAKTLVPSISKTEAARALDILIELGLLIRNAEGKLCRGEARLATARETRSVHIANYHRGMMSRAAAAIELFPSDERDISSTTLCIAADGISRFKESIQRFRSELLELEAIESDPEVVVQINFQLFPLSRKRKEDDNDET